MPRSAVSKPQSVPTEEPGAVGRAASLVIRVRRMRWDAGHGLLEGCRYAARVTCRKQEFWTSWQAPAPSRPGEEAELSWAEVFALDRVRAGSAEGDGRGSLVALSVQRALPADAEEAEGRPYLSREVHFRVPAPPSAAPVSHELTGEISGGGRVRLKVTLRVGPPAAPPPGALGLAAPHSPFSSPFSSPGRASAASPPRASTVGTLLPASKRCASPAAALGPGGAQTQLQLPDPADISPEYADWCAATAAAAQSAAAAGALQGLGNQRDIPFHPWELYSLFSAHTRDAPGRGGTGCAVPLVDFMRHCHEAQCKAPRDGIAWFESETGCLEGPASAAVAKDASVVADTEDGPSCALCRVYQRADSEGRLRGATSAHWSTLKIRQLYQKLFKAAQCREAGGEADDGELSGFEVCRGLLELMDHAGAGTARGGLPAGSAAHTAALLQARLVFEAFDWTAGHGIPRQRLARLCSALGDTYGEQLIEAVDIAFDLMSGPIFAARRGEGLCDRKHYLTKRALADLFYLAATQHPQLHAAGGPGASDSLRLLVAALRHLTAYRLMAPTCSWGRHLSVLPFLGAWTVRQSPMPGPPDPSDPVAPGIGAWTSCVDQLPEFSPPHGVYASDAPTPQELFALFLAVGHEFTRAQRQSVTRSDFLALLREQVPMRIAVDDALTRRAAVQLGFTDGIEAKWSDDGSEMIINLQQTWMTRPPRRLPCRKGGCGAALSTAGAGQLRALDKVLAPVGGLRCSDCGGQSRDRAHPADCSEPVYGVACSAANCPNCHGTGVVGQEPRECGECQGVRTRSACAQQPVRHGGHWELLGALWQESTPGEALEGASGAPPPELAASGSLLKAPPSGLACGSGLTVPQHTEIRMVDAGMMESGLLSGGGERDLLPSEGQRLLWVQRGASETPWRPGAPCPPYSAVQKYSDCDAEVEGLMAFLQRSEMRVRRCVCNKAVLPADARVLTCEELGLQHEHRTTPPFCHPARWVKKCCRECRHGAHLLGRWHWSCCGCGRQDSVHCRQWRREVGGVPSDVPQYEQWLSWGGRGLSRECINALQDGRYGKHRRDTAAVPLTKPKDAAAGIAGLREALRAAGIELTQGAGVVCAITEGPKFDYGVEVGWVLDAVQWPGGFFRPAAAQRAMSVREWARAYAEAPESFEVVFTEDVLLLTFGMREVSLVCGALRSYSLRESRAQECAEHTTLCQVCADRWRQRKHVADSGKAARLFARLDAAAGSSDGRLERDEVLVGVLEALGAGATAGGKLSRELAARRLFAEVFFREFDTDRSGCLDRAELRQLLDRALEAHYYDAEVARRHSAQMAAEMLLDARPAWEQFKRKADVDERTDQIESGHLRAGLLSRDLLAALLDYTPSGAERPKWADLATHFSQAVTSASRGRADRSQPACAPPDCAIS
eukprot:TRINITY_DN5577_c0_g1_i2.p1 TRINITY_DN5577_c0_g1~~TRINITY_DN5577_c0_g1_i2.p1  ORF type:complete len:1411 (+),score=372.99 TRINITY_DN5577_c0_g1_i2:92-4324(+)